MKRWGFFILISTLLFNTAKAATDSLVLPAIYPSFLTAYDIDQGLPVSCVNKIVVDNKGRLWLNPCQNIAVGQLLSIYQFDGNRSYVIPITKPDGTPNSPIWMLSGITPDGLLFGKDKASSQVFLLDPETHESQVYSFSPAEKIISIVVDEENNIFTLNRTSGQYIIYQLLPEGKVIFTTIDKPEIKSEHIVDNLPAFIDQGIMWFLHENKGFFSCKLNSKAVKEYSWSKLLGQELSNYVKLMPNQEFLKMSVDGNGNLIFFLNDLKGFFRFDTHTEQISQHRPLNSHLDRFANYQLMQVNFYADAQKKILTEIRYDQNSDEKEFVIKSSFILLDNKDQLFNYDPVITQAIQKSRFRSANVRNVYSLDFKKEAMVAMGGGLAAIEIQADLSIIPLLKELPARAMVQINKDLVWLKSDKTTLGEIDIAHGKAASFPPFEICKENISISTYGQLINKNRREIWFSTRDSLLFSYQIKDQICTRYPVGVKFHKFNFINENEIALVSLEHEVFIYNLQQKKLRPFLQNGVPLNLGHLANEVYIDHKRILWIASQSGLWRIDLISGAAVRLGKEDGFKGDRFMCIHEDEEGNLWLGTFSEGLHRYNPNNGSVKVIDQNDGLSNNTVVGILADQDGDLWVSTFDGISVLSKEGKVLFELQEEDGLSHREFNRFSYLKTWDGQLIFGGIDGVNIIDPQKVKQVYDQKKELKIYLSSIRFFNKKAAQAIVLRNNFEKTDLIKLPPTHRYIKLDFALSDYANPEKMNFFYRIERDDTKVLYEEEDLWINIGPTSELTLTDLPVGKFTIFVKGSNYKGQWTEQALAISVKVNPFFYQTWQFYFLCSLPFIVGAYFWYRRLITEKKRLEAEVKKRTFQIIKDKELIEEQAAKLLELDEMKSRFFTNISHEFRTPLTIISGMIAQMKNQPDLWMTKGMELIQRNSNHLLSLINQILDLRKLESGALKLNYVQADIIPYLHYITDSFRPIAQSKGIRIHLLSKLKELRMDYDPDKMMHILSNLLSNAVKYTPGEGDIYLQIDQYSNAGDNRLQIQVKDTGQGIKQEHLPHIFDRFYQVEDLATQKSPGSGVGLAYTRELVNLLNGSIEVSSEWNLGTTFTLGFPITHKASIQEVHAKVGLDRKEGFSTVISGKKPRVSPETALKVPTQAIGNTKGGGLLPTLLVVEDNPDVRLYLSSCLAPDYELLLAENGQEGVDLAIEQVPDLIVSDVMMPLKDGYELCDTLKNDERSSHIPIILLTAKADFDSKMSGLKKGADAYLTKPFKEEELLVRLEQLLILRKKLQERYKSQLALPQSTASTKHAAEDAFIEKFRQVVINNIAEENFGVAQLCRSLGVSRTQLHNKIKALTGLSTTGFVRSIRLHKARLLLQTTDLNVSEVGYEVGINNPAYFSRIYSEEFGEAPRRTRK